MVYSDSLHASLGFINFYHHFSPATVVHLQPLHDLVMHRAYSAALNWSEETTQIINDAKELLSDVSLFAHPCPLVPILISSDSYDMGIGMALEQCQSSIWSLPGAPLSSLCSFSHHLTPTEQKYRAFDQELLASHQLSSVSSPTLKYFLVFE